MPIIEMHLLEGRSVEKKRVHPDNSMQQPAKVVHQMHWYKHHRT